MHTFLLRVPDPPTSNEDKIHRHTLSQPYPDVSNTLFRQYDAFYLPNKATNPYTGF